MRLWFIFLFDSGATGLVWAAGLKRALAIALCTVAAICSGIGPSAHAKTIKKDQFSTTFWNGSAVYKAETGKFSFCSAYAKTVTGTEMGFLYTRRGLVLMMGRKEWSLSPGSEYRVTLSVDNRWRRTFNLKADKPDSGQSWLGYIVLGRSARTIDSLKWGRSLSIETRKTTLRFRLNGTKEALTRLEECYRRHNAASRGATANPFGEPERTNPFGEPKSRRHRTAKSYAIPDGWTKWEKPRSSKAGTTKLEQIKEYSAWLLRVNKVSNSLYKILDIVDQVDELSTSYIERSIKADYARRNIRIQLIRLKDAEQSADRELQGLPAPPGRLSKKFLRAGRNLRRYLGQLRESIAQMAMDSREMVKASLLGQETSSEAFWIKAIKRRTLMLRSENVLIKSHNLTIGGDTVQTNINASMAHSNEALIHILDFIVRRAEGGSIVSAVEYRRRLEDSLAAQVRVVAQAGKKTASMKRKLLRSSRLSLQRRRTFERLLENFAEAVATERRIADAITYFGDHVFSVLQTAAGGETSIPRGSIDKAALALQATVDRRTSLQSERLRLVTQLR